MGWKALKEHYNIEHTVHVREGKVMIGSAYISEMITINPDGTFTTIRSLVNYDETDGEVGRYLTDLRATPEKTAELIAQEDHFGPTKTVYSAKNGEIVAQQCEEEGWPNVTTDGELMYENTHYAKKEDALKCALRNLAARVEAAGETVAKIQERLDEAIAYEAKAKQEQQSYKALASQMGVEDDT